MKVAVVGLGVIGKVHYEILKKHGFSPALCDVDESKLEPYPEAQKFTDFSALLERFCPDVVHICTPHYLHADMVVAALKNGASVLVEKPLCIKKEDIPRILAAEKAAKGILGVCHQNRYNPENAYAYNLLQQKKVRGAFGTVVWHRDEKYYHSSPWRGKWQTEGGGALINQALHTLDLLVWTCGMPKTICASTSNLTLQGKIEVEDTAHVRAGGETPFNLLATVGGTTDFPTELCFSTDEGVLKIVGGAVIYQGKKMDFPKENFYGKCCYGSGHEKLISHFYECVERGEKFWLDGQVGTNVVKIILAAYESGEKEVAL